MVVGECVTVKEKRGIRLVNDDTLKMVLSKNPRTGNPFRDDIIREYKDNFNYKAVSNKLGISPYYVHIVILEEGISKRTPAIPPNVRKNFINDFLEGIKSMRQIESDNSLTKGVGPLLLWRAGLTTTIRPPRDYPESLSIIRQYTVDNREINEIKCEGRSTSFIRNILVSAFGPSYSVNKGIQFGGNALKAYATQAILGDNFTPDILRKLEDVPTMIPDVTYKPDDVTDEEIDATVAEQPEEKVRAQPATKQGVPLRVVQQRKPADNEVQEEPDKEENIIKVPAVEYLFKIEVNGEHVFIKASSKAEMLAKLNVTNIGPVPHLLDVLLK